MTAQEIAGLQALARRGARAAADALRVLLGAHAQVELTHTDAALLPDLVSRMGGSAVGATAIAFRVAGALPGSMLLVLPGSGARQLAATLTGMPAASDLGGGAQSALEEAGNILASSYLTEVGRASRLVLLPSVPHVIRGRLDALLDLALEMLGVPPEQVLGLEAGLAARPDGPTMILGHFLAADGAVARLLAPG